ncbi:EAL domain-containing protein [Neobacillus cucumis]|uniref:EAL domain-containing protein n=1 Tax=Neobacillus cucumis TaxID=1740721 RepID=UPI00196561A6|nr:EAL domain-containing protein [Neobacillus cucumis]MBM7655266.1 diguanylate cyclase (GGDEF)-like protein/PAS domain S-box-containing protein [Neobacillus cucumis]
MNVRSIASLSEENTIHTIFDSPELTIWYKDVQEDTLWISKGIASIYGYTQDYIMKNPTILLESVYPEDKWIIENALCKQLLGDSTDVEYRIIRSDGEVRWVQELSHSILDEAGKVIAISGSVRDITLQKRNTLKLQKQLKMKEDQEHRDINDQRYKSLFEHNTNCVYSFDLDGNFTSCNSVCEEATGYRKEELLKPMNFKEMIVPEKLVEVLNHFARCIKGEAQNFRTSILDRKGSIIHLNVTVVPIFVNEGVNGVFGIAQNITKQVEIEKANEHMAYHDYLTGLPNRNKLNASLTSELVSAAKREQKMAVLFMDLDRFKVVNDTLGHNTGDELLKEVAQRLSLSLNDKDIVFRQGGDEFIIILKNADRDVAAKVSRRMMDVVAAPIRIQNYDIYTSPSIGISIFPEDGKTVETLIKRADFAMYQAKKEGKNNFKFYSSYNQAYNINPLKLEMDLHKAVEQGELLLHYQPKVSLKTGKIVGVEALIRWNHPEWGQVSPGTFIPIAEETGLIIPIGEWALYTACKQNKEWQQKGFHTTISVNLSAKQFTLSNLDETVARILNETRLEPRYLELEITESITANIERTITTLQKLKRIGVRISIDDFGTGFSSLNDLQKFPLDTLKIDQSFVRRLQNNPNDETIIKTIISMAHNLNLNVVAEGIETKEQLVFLQEHLCDEGQGYLFTKPLLENELENSIMDIQNVVKEYGISQDVNERMWSEELVRIARKELNETIRLQQGMTFKFKNIDGKFIHTLCDGELLYRLGLIPSLVVGKQLKDFLPEEMAVKKQVYYQRAWNGEENVNYEDELNGISYLAALSPIKRGGEVVEVIGSCIDITDRKKAEKALLESETKYRLIAENMTDLIILFDLNRKGIYASPSHENVLGYSSEYFEGNSTLDLIHPEDVDITMRQFAEVIRTKLPVKAEFRLLHANGEWKLFDCTGTPVMGENDQVEHIMVVSKDITEKRKAEEMLRNAEKLSLVGELAAGVAHEIRNPLTSIKGFIQLFREGFVKPEYFNVILAEFNRVEEIIKEFLTLAKPQEIQPKLVNIPLLLKEIETLLESETLLNDVNFSIEIEQDLPLVMCDANQMKQVLINLCKNSFEATDIKDNGFIGIKAFINQDHLIIQIRDNGVGISEERLKRLGEPFYSNKEKGTGLGLMTCFRIIKQHKGTLTFDSKENQGTTVEIRLPLGLVENNYSNSTQNG